MYSLDARLYVVFEVRRTKMCTVGRCGRIFHEGLHSEVVVI